MGMRGNRHKEEPKPIEVKRPRNSDAHRNLCVLVGKWLRKHGHNYPPTCPYVAIELVTMAGENPDAFGWNYYTSILVEVKVSHSDFIADAKKWFRIYPEKGLGDYRYYCCPEGIIKEDELPASWGLLYEKDGDIEVVKKAEFIGGNICAERSIYGSICRREGIKPQLFDYRNNKAEER